MRIGIDLGGTKIEAAAIDRQGQVALRQRVATPAGDYAATIAAVRGLVAALETALGRRCPVGIGMPGSLSPTTGLVRNSNSTCLNGRPFDRDLTQALARPLRFANDANCFALSEAIDGAAAGASVVFGVILGTGVGGGIVVERRPIPGANAIAGEWGHTPLPWPGERERPGPPCYCGKNGCLETFISGPGLALDHRQATGAALDAAAIAARPPRRGMPPRQRASAATRIVSRAALPSSSICSTPLSSSSAAGSAGSAGSTTTCRGSGAATFSPMP